MHTHNPHARTHTHTQYICMGGVAAVVRPCRGTHITYRAHTHTHTLTHTHTHTHTHAHTHTPTHTHTITHIYIYISIYTGAVAAVVRPCRGAHTSWCCADKSLLTCLFTSPYGTSRPRTCSLRYVYVRTCSTEGRILLNAVPIRHYSKGVCAFFTHNVFCNVT